MTADELIRELYLALKVLWAEVDDPQLMDVAQEALHLAACYIDDHPAHFGSALTRKPTTTRVRGYYWVRYVDRWMPAKWDGDCWYLIRDHSRTTVVHSAVDGNRGWHVRFPYRIAAIVLLTFLLGARYINNPYLNRGAADMNGRTWMWAWEVGKIAEHPIGGYGYGIEGLLCFDA
jgi:hypothetical protein